MTSLVFKQHDDELARQERAGLAAEFATFAGDDIDEVAAVFNSAVTFARERGLSSTTMGSVLAALCQRDQRVARGVLREWAREGPEALNEHEIPGLSDTLTNMEVQAHAARADWSHAALSSECHRAFEALNVTFFNGELPQPTIAIEDLRRRTLGTYRLGRDGLGMVYRITLNSLYVDDDAQLLETLLHEMVHEFEEVTLGRRRGGTYHTSAFREKALQFGIPVTETGVSLGSPTGRFAEFLRRYRVNAPSEERMPMRPATPKRPRPRVALRPWWCGCTRIWAAAKTTVEGTCSCCGATWVRADEDITAGAPTQVPSGGVA